MDKIDELLQQADRALAEYDSDRYHQVMAEYRRLYIEEKYHMGEYRVIIAGGRHFNDYKLLQERCLYYMKEKMKEHLAITVSAHATGADTLGKHKKGRCALRHTSLSYYLSSTGRTPASKYKKKLLI